MKKNYSGLVAYKINLNGLDVTTISQCKVAVQLENTGSGTCDYCGQIEEQNEGYTQEV